MRWRLRKHHPTHDDIIDFDPAAGSTMTGDLRAGPFPGPGDPAPATQRAGRPQAATTHSSQPAALQLGVFYDGSWFGFVSDYYGSQHPRRARLSILGLHDVFRWRISQTLQRPLERCRLAAAHWFGHRLEQHDHAAIYNVLESARVTIHTLPLGPAGEKGVDVLLALETLEHTRAHPLDAVVLVTGDADFVPLVWRLQAAGAWVMVPAVKLPRAKTASALRQAVDDAPELEELLHAAAAADVRLHSPLRLAPGVDFQQRAANGAARRTGIVTRCNYDETYGFLEEDASGAAWWFGRDSGGVDLAELAVGQEVSFTGAPYPRPGRRTPAAYTIRLVNGATPPHDQPA